VARPTSSSNTGVIQTSGEFFADGSVLELLRAQTEPEKVKLLHWNGNVLDVAAHVEHAGVKYAPAAIDPNLRKALRLPTHVPPPETTESLFIAAHDLLQRHLGQLDSCITAMVCAVFCSWMSPALSMAPIFWIFSPAGSPRNLALQLLSLLVRRPLRLVGLRRSDIPCLPMSLQPTFLLDEPDLRPEMQKLLQSSMHRGTRIVSGHGLLDFFGPKIVFSNKLPRGTALETDAPRAILIPIVGQLPTLGKKMEEEIAEEFQARFLGHFLRNASNAQSASFDASQFTSPIQDIARTVSAAVMGDGDVQKRILSLLAVQDEEVRADHARTCDAVVLEALLFFIHAGGWSKVRTDNIGEKVNAIFKGRGSDQQPSPETVGWAIRRLGIPSGRIDRAGNGVELNLSTCQLIHRLAQSHGVRAMDGGLRSDCRYCRELEVMVAQATT
jgi:hypothetical protein